MGRRGKQKGDKTIELFVFLMCEQSSLLFQTLLPKQTQERDYNTTYNQHLRRGVWSTNPCIYMSHWGKAMRIDWIRLQTNY